MVIPACFQICCFLPDWDVIHLGPAEAPKRSWFDHWNGQRHSRVFSSSEVGRKNTTFQQVEFYIEVLKWFGLKCALFLCQSQVCNSRTKVCNHFGMIRQLSVNNLRKRVFTADREGTYQVCKPRCRQSGRSPVVASGFAPFHALLSGVG